MEHSISSSDSINTEIQREEESSSSSSSHEFCSRSDDHHDTVEWVGFQDASSQSEKSSVTHSLPPLRS